MTRLPRLLGVFPRDDRKPASMDWLVLSVACVALGLSVSHVVATEIVNLPDAARAQLHHDLYTNPFSPRQ